MSTCAVPQLSAGGREPGTSPDCFGVLRVSSDIIEIEDASALRERPGGRWLTANFRAGERADRRALDRR